MENFIVYGLGKSGISTIKSLAKNFKQHVIIGTDDNLLSLQNSELLALKNQFSNIDFLAPDEINFNKDSKIIFSPGIPLYFPKAHKILEICQKTNAKLICDLELFYQQNHFENNFIGITGTNGKSTTTALIGFILNHLKISSEIAGNIGIPCFELPIAKNFCYIFEASSFQLDLMNETKFNIANLTNITPDHLDRHGSMLNYIQSKKKIFANQNKSDFTIINLDDQISLDVYYDLKNDRNFQAQLIGISTRKISDHGVSIIDGIIHNNIFNDKFKLPINSKYLKGEHNDQNIAFAFASCFCHLYQKSSNNFNGELISKKIIEAIELFKGLRHRLQIVKEIDNLRFINDSKATNADSTLHALNAYDNIFWILGGRAKEGGISSLQPYFNKIIKAYLIGEASNDFAKILAENNVKFEKCFDLKTAFSKSLADVKNYSLSQNNILLSPACASLDQFKNFEDRGDYFCKLVEDHFNS